MKIIAMGTGPFAVPSFQWLLDSEHSVPLLVTRPIDDSGKRRKSAANPMRDVADQRKLPVFDPSDVNHPQAVQHIAAFQPDLLVVCDYGQILSSDCLAVAGKGGINLHGSLLPKYRGAAPVNWAIYHGESETGVTVIHMTPALDAGPNLVQRSLAIGDDETAPDLELRLSQLGVEAVADAIGQLETWDGSTPIGTRQDKSGVTKAPRLTKSMGQIDWSRSATQIRNQVRAFQPWPGSFSTWNSPHSKPLRLIVLQTRVADSENSQAPGTVERVTEEAIEVAAGQGRLVLQVVQPAGKRIMQVAEFLRGRNVRPGDRFTDGER